MRLHVDYVASVEFLGFLSTGSSLCLISLVASVLWKYSFKAWRALLLWDMEFLVSDGISAYLQIKNKKKISHQLLGHTTIKTKLMGVES